MRARALQDPEIGAAAPYVEGQALRGRRRGARGRDGARSGSRARAPVSNIGSDHEQGDIGALTPDSYNVVIGASLASLLGVDVGDEVVLVLAEGA